MENKRFMAIESNENLKRLLSKPTHKLGGFTLDIQNRELTFGSEIIKLTRKETYLFVLLADNVNNVLERSFILETIWGENNYLNSRSMDVYICKIRKILSKDQSIIIINLHGKGYRLIVG